MSKLTKEQAIELAKSEWWKGLSAHDIVMFQLFESRLCMDFSDFHKALEECLGRGVWTHELGLDCDGIKKEFLGDRSAPTFEQICNLIPVDKRMIVITDQRPATTGRGRKDERDESG